MGTAIEARDLVRDFGKVRAVDNVSFGVEAREIFGFLGPNGAGKTTTIRMLTTLLEPTSGSVLIGGFDTRRQAYQARRQMGLVPEESNVYTELSAWDNLMFSARLYRVPGKERDRRAEEFLDIFDLKEKRNFNFSALGILFASAPAQSPGAIMMPSTLLRWPLLFISGIFVPLPDMAPWARVLSFVSPLTYTQDLFNHALLGTGAQDLALDLVAFPICLVLFLAFALKLHDLGRQRGD